VRYLQRPDRRYSLLFLLSAHPHRARPQGFDHRRTDPRRRNLASGMQGVIDEQGFQSAFCMRGFAGDAQKTFQLPRWQQASRSPMSRWHAGGSGMGLDINNNNLWRLRDEDEWLDARDRYWVDPTVCRTGTSNNSCPRRNWDKSRNSMSTNGMTFSTNISGGSSWETIWTKD
jgi:hypothetical protein